MLHGIDRRLPPKVASGTGAEAASGASRSRAGAPAPSRVLLVDDDHDAAESLGYLLEHLGHQVVVADSGDQALEIAAVERFDVLVSDLDMPMIDGCSLLRELRRRPATAHLPAVALSGHATPDDVARALAAGFDRHIAKPADAAVVSDAIDVLRQAPHPQAPRR